MFLSSYIAAPAPDGPFPVIVIFLLVSGLHQPGAERVLRFLNSSEATMQLQSPIGSWKPVQRKETHYMIYTV